MSVRDERLEGLRFVGVGQQVLLAEPLRLGSVGLAIICQARWDTIAGAISVATAIFDALQMQGRLPMWSARHRGLLFALEVIVYLPSAGWHLAEMDVIDWYWRRAEAADVLRRVAERGEG